MTKIEKNDYIEEISGEDEDVAVESASFEINSWGADLSFRELISMYKEGDLLKPELQRNYVWDKNEASRFIESLLMGLPVPSIFLARRPDSRYLIIDGYQRIMTVHDYVSGIFSKDQKVFKLSNSKSINELWRGKAFSELTAEEQRRIKITTIHSIIFEQTNPKNDSSLYQIFERINTSGRTLLPQEIRNCVYQGELNSLLIKLNSNTKWREFFGNTENDIRMRDMEFILRFFALSSQDIQGRTSGQISLKKYLNEFMGDELNNSRGSIETFEEEFSSTIDFLYDNIGKHAFSNISTQYGITHFLNKFHPTIFDAISIASLFELREKGSIDVQENIMERQLALLKDDDFIDAITVRTTNIDKIKKRIELARKYLFGDHHE